jgi:transposase
MAKPLSEDLRMRVVRAVDGGMSRRAAAARFGISPSSAVRFVREWRERGSIGAKRQGGDQRSQRIETHRELILGAIEAKPDLTLVEIAAKLKRERGASFAPSTIWRFFDRHSVSFKKNHARSRAGKVRRRGSPRGLARTCPAS